MAERVVTAAVVPEDLLDRYETRAQRARVIRLRREAAERRMLTSGQEGLVARLPGAPAETGPLGTKRAAAWLGCSHSQLLAMAYGHAEELASVACRIVVGGKCEYTPRGLLHLALMMDPERHLRAGQVLAAVRGRPFDGMTAQQRRAAHATATARQIERAARLAVEVRELDGRDIWSELEGLDRWQLQTCVVALAAMVPPELPGAGWLAALGRAVGDGAGSAAGRGLAALVPDRRTGEWR